MTSTALVGLTGPIGYHYDVENEFGFPNPILESPTALMLLYDEICFVHPKVCPKNMRDLDYVKFLSDREDLRKYRDLIDSSEDLDEIIPEGKQNRFKELEGYQIDWNQWELATKVAPDGVDRIDDHSRGIINNVFASVKLPWNFYFDIAIAVRKNMDFISNSILDSSIRTTENKLKPELELTEQVVGERIPNIQKREGPYVEIIDDLRASPYLSNFRKKMTDAQIQELEEAQAEIEQKFDRYRNEALKDRHNKFNQYRSTASLILSDVNPEPITSTVVGGGDTLLDIYQTRKSRKKHGWASFLSDVELQSSTQRD